MMRFLIVWVLWIVALQFALAKDTVVISDTMYQNQAFTPKEKEIFDTDWEGMRVWRWSKAQSYCQKLKLEGYDGWRVASRKELEAIMADAPSKNGLYVKSPFASKMPPLGGKYDDVWFWTRDSKSSKVGAFANFKKAKSGWADKSYKGYVLCTRSVGKEGDARADSVKLKKPILFDNNQEVWYSDLTKKGTGALGNYRLLYFYCQNFPSASIPAASRFIKHKNTTYFFAYNGKNKKSLNLYRTNGKPKGTKKIGSIGKEVAYSPIWVGNRLYFLSSEYLPQQDDPMEEKLWVLDTNTHHLSYVGETAVKEKTIMRPFVKSKKRLFFKRTFYDTSAKIAYEDLLIVKKRGFKKIKRFKGKIPKTLKKIEVSGRSYDLEPVTFLKWGCDDSDDQESFKIKEKALWYRDTKIAKLSGIKGLKVYGVALLFNGEKYAILASGKYLWGVDREGEIWRIR